MNLLGFYSKKKKGIIDNIINHITDFDVTVSHSVLSIQMNQMMSYVLNELSADISKRYIQYRMKLDNNLNHLRFLLCNKRWTDLHETTGVESKNFLFLFKYYYEVACP